MLIRMLLIVTGLFLVACSSPRDASEENYRAVIETYFAERDDFPDCFFRYSFPISGGGWQWKMGGLEKKLTLLAELGLVHHESKELNKGFVQHHYTLTEEGKKYYIEERGLCMGKPRLLGLKDVSKPYEERGKTLVDGKYLWTVDLPEWAMQKRFYEAETFSGELHYFRYEKLLNDQPRTDYFTLRLGDEGWGF